MMRELELTQNRVAIVDDEDFEWLSQFKWSAHVRTNNIYAMRGVTLDGTKRLVGMHQLILDTFDTNLYADHINRNGLDNRRCNLRIATNSQNGHNSRPHNGKTKGVHWYKARKKWQTYISVNGTQLHLGYFKKKQEALDAYDAAAIKHYGEFAYTNKMIAEEKSWNQKT